MAEAAERVMGLDVGDATIGVAVSDPLAVTAQPVEVIRRAGLGADLDRLGQLARTWGVARIVVGLPRNMNGTLGPQAQKVMDFCRRLEAALGLPVETWDERLSTRAVERVLLQADVSRARRKRTVDRLAAALILQGYLDARR